MVSWACTFDKVNGNAEFINELMPRYDWDIVFASHSLEHMYQPKEVAARWLSLVKPGGCLFILVPDARLYEQGFFPSIFNSDHKAQFSISEGTVPNEKSLILISDLILHLKNNTNCEFDVEYLALQDANFNYDLLKRARIGRRLYGLFPQLYWWGAPLLKKLGWHPIDQTLQSDTCAQICLVFRVRNFEV